MDDSVNYGTRTSGQGAASLEMRTMQYKASVMGNKKICLPTSHDEGEFKRAPGKVACLICGEPVAENAAYHYDAQSELCILDLKATLRAGLISRVRYDELVTERADQPKQ